LGIRSNGIIRMENVLSQRYLGDITLAPELLFNDVKKILSNPDLAFATKFIQNGERTTWQSMFFF
jgi:TAG lipase/steryl ester hydrolase/phospholipase A2/LPA acyltransferase